MVNQEFHLARIRTIVFAVVAIIHAIIIMFMTFKIKTTISLPEPVAGVMKLVDVEERLPPPPERPPPDMPYTNTQEAIAETMIETDEVPPPVIWPIQPQIAAPEQIDYLPQHRITRVPVFPEDQIRRATVYPPIAQRSNIEGTVYLELFIDGQGSIRDVRVLKEDPPGRGFGDAAVNAFKGIRAKPAEANGVAVAVRYRYNISFRLN
jgi:protein TonB